MLVDSGNLANNCDPNPNYNSVFSILHGSTEHIAGCQMDTQSSQNDTENKTWHVVAYCRFPLLLFHLDVDCESSNHVPGAGYFVENQANVIVK